MSTTRCEWVRLFILDKSSLHIIAWNLDLAKIASAAQVYMTVDLPPAISHAMHVRGEPSSVFMIFVDEWPPEKQIPAVCTRSLWSSFLPNQTRAASGVNYLVCTRSPVAGRLFPVPFGRRVSWERRETSEYPIPGLIDWKHCTLHFEQLKIGFFVQAFSFMLRKKRRREKE